jgi:hypothetical protein
MTKATGLSWDSTTLAGASYDRCHQRLELELVMRFPSKRVDGRSGRRGVQNPLQDCSAAGRSSAR